MVARTGRIGAGRWAGRILYRRAARSGRRIRVGVLCQQPRRKRVRMGGNGRGDGGVGGRSEDETYRHAAALLIHISTIDFINVGGEAGGRGGEGGGWAESGDSKEVSVRGA